MRKYTATRNVFCDIETIPAGEMLSLESIKIPGNIKKEETKQKWLEENGQAEIERQYHERGLDSMQGEIFCIGVAVEDDDPIVFDTIAEMADFMESGSFNYIGHNFRKFDAKFIWRHLIKHGRKYAASMFNFNKFHGNIIDTMELWACDDYQDRISLNNIARFLGVGNKTKGMDGSQVWSYVKAGRLQEVKDYCADDVRLVRRVYNAIV